MLQVVINVNAPSWKAQTIKESMAMYLEKFGDSRVAEVRESQPQLPKTEQQRFY